MTYKISHAVYTLVIAAALGFAILAHAADGDSATPTPSLEEYKTKFVPTTIKNTDTNDELEFVMRRHYLHKFGYSSEVLLGFANSPNSKASVVSSALNDLLTVGGWDLYLQLHNGPFRINFDLKRFKSPETQHGLFKLKVRVAQMLVSRWILERGQTSVDVLKMKIAEILEDVHVSVLSLRMLEGQLLSRDDRRVLGRFLDAVSAFNAKVNLGLEIDEIQAEIMTQLGSLRAVIAICDLYLTQNR